MAIGADVTLAGAVLGLANSSAYGHRRGRIATIDEAVGKLGFDAIKKMATGMAVLRAVRGDTEGTPNNMKLWEHSFASAMIAKTLADKDESDSQGTLYLAGLLHDVGKFVIVEYFPECMPAIMEAKTLRQEAQSLGADHAWLGAKVLSQWTIPEEITRIAQAHHTVWPSRAPYDHDEMGDVLAVQIADGLALALGFDSGLLDYFPDIHNDALAHCHALDSLDPTDLQEAVRAQVMEMKVMVGVFGGRDVSPSAEATVDTGPRPPINYVSVESPQIDFVRMWLELSQGYTVQDHYLDCASEDIDPDSPVIVDASRTDPRPERVAQMRALLSRHRGVVIADEAWRQHISEAACDGWYALRTPLALRVLETSLTHVINAKPPDS